MKTTPTALLCALTIFLSCNQTESVSAELDALEARIAALEDKVAAVNSNAVASKEFLDTTIVISSIDSIDNGYRLTLTGGKVVEVIFGAEAPGIVPMIGVDSTGRWVMSIDGGLTFSVIDKADDPRSGFGRTPKVRVDGDGYWTVSYDGGATFERILDADGRPISAVDSREVAGTYAFFANVLVDREKGLVTFNLADGSSAVIPLYCASEVNAPLFCQKDRIFRGETVEYDCTVKDVASAIWHTVPSGWDAELTDSKLSFTAPSGAASGEYTFELLTVSGNGVLRSHTYVLTLDDRMFFDDFDKGDTPNPKYWEAIPPKYSTGWYKYLSGDFSNATVSDGSLYLTSYKLGDTFKAAGIRTTGYYGQCRYEVRARFQKVISSGVNHAIWLFPAPYSPTWPIGGEVDIVEHLNNIPYAYQTIHSNYTYNLGLDTGTGTGKQTMKTAIQQAEFNTYGVELTQEAVIFYINGVETHRYANAHLEDESEKGQYPFYTSDFYLLLSPHLGTNWAGEVAGDELPTVLEIDWVKITEL